ncbi:MAG: hypothetical protein SCL54_13005 [Bacillota bacterium]|nr:hypothetical protein [Bacillota bacterium]
MAVERAVLFRIERINAMRLRIVGYIAIVLELLLLLFYDLPNLANTESQMALSLAYLGAHLFLLIISIAVVIAGSMDRETRFFGTSRFVDGTV